MAVEFLQLQSILPTQVTFSVIFLDNVIPPCNMSRMFNTINFDIRDKIPFYD